LTGNIASGKRQLAINATVEAAVGAAVTKNILENKRRVDGRKLDEIRALSADVEILPRNHGSGLFSRGETQIMSIVTLGAPGMAKPRRSRRRSTKRFMHHYNFPPYASVRPSRCADRGEGRSAMVL